MVSLKVYNLLGLEVATLVNGRQEAGSYTVPFGINTGTFGLSSGVYFYRLEAGSFVSTKKLILMK
jgi:hemolysin activation/secretion protein